MVALSFSRTCVRGNLAERDKRGRCLCPDCREFRAAYKSKWVSKNIEIVRLPSRCKRGNFAERDKWGQCQCSDCKVHRANIYSKWQKKNPDKRKGYMQKW